jgi:uncharacterized protein
MSKDLSPSFRLGVPPVVDVFEFARRGQLIEGVFAVNRLDRLLEDVPEQPFAELVVLEQAPLHPGLVKYLLQGRRSKVGKLQLVAKIQALLVLECQRCLGDLLFPVDRQAVFELVVRESDLDQGDLDDADLDAPEKMMGSATFNLLDLLEDELILEVPYVPRHETCPESVGGAEIKAQAENSSPEAQLPSPFAVLGQLKIKGK